MKGRLGAMLAPQRAGRRLIVHADASWSDGVAAVAVAGHVPFRCELMQLRSPTIAEAEALLLAMAVLAEHDGTRRALLRTDHQGIVWMTYGRGRARAEDLAARITAIRAHLQARRHWRVQHVHRSVVHDAHELAQRALRAHLSLPEAQPRAGDQ